LSAIIGLDVGGTTLKAVKILDRQTIAAQTTLTAGGHITREELAGRIAGCVADLSRDDSPDAVGLCFGGLLQSDGSMRKGSTNLSNLDGILLREYFSDLLRLPCRVENDAISAMRGEATLGAARGHKHAMTMTFGSGIGSGLLLDGHIRQGAHGRAGEIGVWRLSPRNASDIWISFEDLAAPERYLRRHGSELAELLQRSTKDETSTRTSFVFELIGRAVANAHLLLDLEAVILTGGITALGEMFRRPIEVAYLAACPSEYHHGLQIKIGALGPYAGAIGAAALWFENQAHETDRS
jgi:glucokinase